MALSTSGNKLYLIMCVCPHFQHLYCEFVSSGKFLQCVSIIQANFIILHYISMVLPDYTNIYSMHRIAGELTITSQHLDDIDSIPFKRQF